MPTATCFGNKIPSSGSLSWTKVSRTNKYFSAIRPHFHRKLEVLKCSDTKLHINSLCTLFVNNKFDAQFFFLHLFILILYMFRATKCSSSGESIVSIRPLEYVTICRWHIPEVVLIQLTLVYVTYIQWHIPEVVLIQLTLVYVTYI